MAKVRELVDGDVIDVADLPVEIDLDEYPLVEYELGVVTRVEPEASTGRHVVYTREHGSWAVDPDFEVPVRGRVRR